MATIMRAIGEQMLQPWPALADDRDDPGRRCCVLHIGCGQVDHQRAPVHVYRSMTLVPLVH